MSNHAESCYQTELYSRLDEYETSSGYKDAERACFGPEGLTSVLSGMDVYWATDGDKVVMTAQTRTDLEFRRARNVWSKANRKLDRFRDALIRELCARYGLDPHWGGGVHCTCGADTSPRNPKPDPKARRIQRAAFRALLRP